MTEATVEEDICKYVCKFGISFFPSLRWFEVEIFCLFFLISGGCFALFAFKEICVLFRLINRNRELSLSKE